MKMDGLGKLIIGAMLCGGIIVCAGCVSTSVPPPTYLMEAQPSTAGLVYVFDLEYTFTSAGPFLGPFNVEFTCPRLVDEKTVSGCKTYMDLMGQYPLAMVPKSLSTTVNGLGCFALPEGEYYAKPLVPGYARNAGGMLAAAKTGGTNYEAFQKMLAFGGAPFRSEIGKAAVIWVRKTEGETSSDLSLEMRKIGTIRDPDLNAAGAQEDLFGWIRSGSLEKRYVAVLLLSKVGNTKAIAPLRDLAQAEPRLAVLAQKTLAGISRRTDSAVPSR